MGKKGVMREFSIITIVICSRKSGRYQTCVFSRVLGAHFVAGMAHKEGIECEGAALSCNEHITRWMEWDQERG